MAWALASLSGALPRSTSIGLAPAAPAVPLLSLSSLRRRSSLLRASSLLASLRLVGGERERLREGEEEPLVPELLLQQHQQTHTQGSRESTSAGERVERWVFVKVCLQHGKGGHCFCARTAAVACLKT